MKWGTKLKDEKRQLEAREQQIRFRLANIQMELTMRGVLNRGDAERELRAAMQRELSDIHNEKEELQQRIDRAQREAERARQKADQLKALIDKLIENAEAKQ